MAKLNKSGKNSTVSSFEDAIKSDVQEGTPVNTAPVEDTQSFADSVGSFMDDATREQSLDIKPLAAHLIESGRFMSNDKVSGLNPDNDFVKNAVKQIAYGVAMAGTSDKLRKVQESVAETGTAGVTIPLQTVLVDRALNRFAFLNVICGSEATYTAYPVKNSSGTPNINGNLNIRVTIGADNAGPAIFQKDPARYKTNTGEIKDFHRVVCRQDASGNRTNNAAIALDNGQKVQLMPIKAYRRGLNEDTHSYLEMATWVKVDRGNGKTADMLFIGTIGSGNVSKISEEASYKLDESLAQADSLIIAPFMEKTYLPNGMLISHAEKAEIVSMIFNAFSKAYPDGIINTNLGYVGQEVQVNFA